MSNVGTNSGVGQAQGSSAQTANPQQIGAQSLQITRPLQGAGAQSSVLGITDVLQTQSSSSQITVEGSDGSGATTATTEQIPQTAPIDPNGFVFSPWLVTAVVASICIAAFMFVWNQRKPARY